MSTTVASAYRFGSFQLVVSTRELWRGETHEVLPRRVFDCLLYLLERRERAVGRDELAAAIWERVDVSDGQIGQLVLRVRRALDDDGQAQAVIRTIPGFGYRWVCPVDPIVDPAADRPDEPSNRPAIPLPNKDAWLPLRSQRPAFVAMLAALAMAALFVLILSIRVPTAGDVDDGITLVLPVTSVNDHADSAWMRLGLMDLIAEHLRSAGLPVPQSEHAVALAAQLTDDEAMSETVTPDRFPPAARIGRVIHVRVEHVDEGWRLSLDALAADGSRHRQAAEERDAVVAARLATNRLLAALGHLPPPTDPIEAAIEERLQRAQAALLANELEIARRILLDADEHDRDDPRVRLRLAQIEFRAGHVDSARAALDALIDAPSTGVAPRLRSQALRSRGSLYIRIGRDVEAEQDFHRASDIAPESAQAERGWALNGRAVARLILGRLDEAATDLGRARVHLERAGDVHGVLSVDNNMGLLELTRLRPAQAIAHSDEAARQFEALGAVNEALSAQSVAVEAHLSQLQWHDALAVNERGWALRRRVQDPDVLLSLDVLRARILLGLGRLGEAAGLLEVSRTSDGQTQDWNRAEHSSALAELAWLRGDPDTSAEHAEHTLALQPLSPHDGRRARIVLLALRSGAADIAQMLTDINAPAEHVEFSPYLLLASAELGAMRHAPPEQTDARFRTALGAAEQRGLPAEIAAAAWSYGLWLLAADREADAAAVIGRVAPWAERDFDCAVLQIALFHAQGDLRAWARALERAERLAGERKIPDVWRNRPGSVRGRSVRDETDAIVIGVRLSESAHSGAM